jgi:hypothetical protein
LACTFLPRGSGFNQSSDKRTPVRVCTIAQWCQGKLSVKRGRPGGRSPANRPVRAATQAWKVGTERLLLLQVGADPGDQLVAQGIIEQRPVGTGEGRTVAAQRKVFGVRIEQGIVGVSRIRGVT